MMLALIIGTAGYLIGALGIAMALGTRLKIASLEQQLAQEPWSRLEALPARPARRVAASRVTVRLLTVSPLLVFSMLGVVEMGSAWSTYQAVGSVAHDGLLLAVSTGAHETDVRAAMRAKLAEEGLEPDDATIELLCPCFGPSRVRGETARASVAYPARFLLAEPIFRYFTGAEMARSGTIQSELVMRVE
jgi:hypothetical protein